MVIFIIKQKLNVIILYFTNTLHTLMSNKKIIDTFNDRSVSKYNIYYLL